MKGGFSSCSSWICVHEHAVSSPCEGFRPSCASFSPPSSRNAYKSETRGSGMQKKSFPGLGFTLISHYVGEKSIIFPRNKQLLRTIFAFWLANLLLFAQNSVLLLVKSNTLMSSVKTREGLNILVYRDRQFVTRIRYRLFRMQLQLRYRRWYNKMCASGRKQINFSLQNHNSAVLPYQWVVMVIPNFINI